MDCNSIAATHGRVRFPPLPPNTQEKKLTKIHIEENDDNQENFIGFENGKVTTWSGVSFSGYGHKFNEDNTRKLYQAMRKYYETKT